ncbi:DNA-binding response regulator [Actinomadura logoneensis]|uniref:DNA-binding response regulator n=1 Tax=Actinomadura logoneensis TaxID=2293572 RepID=A0A372JA39_9ACTN|nr:response regulator transcription factor [Actinomadura logoneensis]RFU36852.1 DNA-binding response regulator [Actinomadura logoneensis]
MIRVILAENIHLFRSGLVALLDGEADIRVVETVDCGRKLLAATAHCRPEVALVDLGLPDLDGVEAAARLLDLVPQCAVIIMAERRQPGDLRRAVAAGAVGFLLKDTSPERLVQAIHDVAAGERVIDAELAFAELATSQSPLTPRELEVLRETAKGATVAEIARSLFLATGTVRNYLARIVSKVGARTRLEAVAIAEENGWLGGATPRAPRTPRTRSSPSSWR